MSQQFVPPMRAPLVDGRELRVEPDGVHIGERSHSLAQIQEARLLFWRPETIGLRMADVGLVEYSFARQGDGVAALETLYQLRPELRRDDAPAPALDAPAGYFAPAAEPTPLATAAPPLPGAPPTPGQPDVPYGIFGSPTAPAPPQFVRSLGPALFPPQVIAAYGPEPNQTHAGLTPVPRTAGQLIGSAFRLLGKRFGALLTLALLVATLPMAVAALLNAIVAALSGINPLAAGPNPLQMIQQAASGQTPSAAATTATTAATPLDTVIGLLSLAALTLMILVWAWSQAALTVGAREATLGRPISARACAREGLTRLWPTLWALFFLYGMLALVAIPGLALALGLVLAPGDPATSGALTVEDSIGLAIVAGIVAIATLMLVAYLWCRFALYPTAAALGLPQPLRVSLSLTTFGLFRVFWALFVVTLATGLLIFPAYSAQWFSVALGTVALSPLAQLITGPLGALVRVVTLYDQRLRREGYLLFVQEGMAPPPDAAATPTPEHPTEVGR